MKKRNFLWQIYLRVKADTPSFFKKMAQTGAGLSAFMAAVLIIPNSPEWLSHIADKVIWASSVMTLLPLLVVKNTNEADEIIYKK